MTQAGLPVPRGFVVTPEAFQAALRPLRSRLDELWRSIDVDDPESLAGRSAELRELVLQVELPATLCGTWAAVGFAYVVLVCRALSHAFPLRWSR